MKPIEDDTLVRKTLRARDLPKSWNVAVPGGPDTPITVIVKKRETRKRPLASYVRVARAVHSTAREADEQLRQLRDEWESKPHSQARPSISTQTSSSMPSKGSSPTPTSLPDYSTASM